LITNIDKWSILAGIRFLLASIVAVNHLVDYTPLGWLGFISAFGAFEAILGFLLISGYSISVSYTKQPQGFLWRRILRLYPIYFTAMAATYLSFVVLKVPPPHAATLILNALFLNQLVTSDSFVGPAWSLSLEFWLYCLTPFLMRLPMTLTRLMVFGSFACYLIYTILRTLSHMPYYSGVGFGANLLLLSFIWLAGLRLARSGGEKTALRDIGFIFAGHIALDAIIQFGWRLKHHALSNFFSNDAVGFVLQSATLLFVYFAFKHLVLAARPATHRSWLLRFVGDISYPLYLLHAAVYGLLVHLGFKNPLLFYGMAVLVSALVYASLDFYSKRRHQQVGTN
jgi:peptidoglycan/LPS O-acetylase OafA/YrhL